MIKTLIYGKCADSSGTTAFTTFKNTWDAVSEKIQKAIVYGSLGNGNELGWGLSDIGRIELELSDITASEKALFKTGNSGSSELHCFVSYDGATYPVGKFYINKVESKPRNNDNYDIKITAYDGLVLADESKFIPSIYSFPISPRTLMADIMKCCGLSCYNTSQLTTSNCITAVYENISCREMIDYIALINAGYTNYGSVVNWYNTKTTNGINVDSKLNFTKYGASTISVPWDRQYSGEQKETADGNITYGGIITGNNTEVITYPSSFSGQAVNFENPFMTKTIAQNFYTRVINNGSPLLQFIPVEVKYRPDSITNFGNLIGQKLNIYKKDGSSYTSYLSEYIISIGGGFSVTYKGYGASDSEKEFIISPTEAKIKRESSRLEEALSTAYQKISGVNGGYVKVLDLDGDGNPDNIFITDSQISEKDIVKSGNEYVLDYGTGVTNVLRINYNGLYISTGVNAGTTTGSYQMAIDGGSVNASAITTGTLNADLITTGRINNGTNGAYWDLDTGEFVSGDNSFIRMASGYLNIYAKQKKIGWIGATSSNWSTLDKNNTSLSFTFMDENVGGIQFKVEDSNQNETTIVEINKGSSQEGTGGQLVTMGSQFGGLVHQRKIASTGSPYEVKVGVGRSDSGGRTNLTFSTVSLYSSLNMPTSSYSKPSGVTNYSYYGRVTSSANTFYPLTKKISRTADYRSILVSCTYACYGWNKLAVRQYDSNNNVLSTTDISDYNQTQVVTISKASCDFEYGCTQFEIGTIPQSGYTGYWAGWKDVTLKFVDEGGTASLELSRNNTVLSRIDVGRDATTDQVGRLRISNGSNNSKWLTFGRNYIQPFSFQKGDGSECGYITYKNSTNVQGLAITPGNHSDGTYGVEIVDDNSSGAQGIKLRPNTTTWDYYLGSGSYPWQYGYITNIYSDLITLSSKQLWAEGSTLYFNGYAVRTSADSDRNVKNSIEPLNKKYDEFFNKLKPVSFKYNDNDSQIYTGLIAQDVEKALEDSGLSNSDIGIIGERISKEGEVINKTLDYDKLITLCIDKIQKLEKRVEELEKAVNQK